jgi:penicillin amidase
VINIPVGNALWIAHDESDEFKTFYLLNRAKITTDYREALKYYTAPAQNFIFASADNDIAITVNGKLPLNIRTRANLLWMAATRQTTGTAGSPLNKTQRLKTRRAAL